MICRFNLILSVAISSIFLISAFVFPANAASLNVTGFAWSDNIGWIQFNPAFGGVSFDDATGNLSGYAWSDSIGWVDFNPAGPYPGVPNSSAMIDPVTGIGSGWLKAILGGTAGSGGWDGWIKMAGTADDGGSYGVVVDPNTGVFSGFAWGSDVVGWVDFKPSIGFGGVTVPPWGPSPVPTVDLKVNGSDNPPSVPAPADLVVSWITTEDSQLSSCSGTGHGWTGPKSTLSGNDSGGNLDNIPAGTYTYSITCDKTTGGTISDSVNITITASAAPIAPSGLAADAATDCEKINLTWTDNSGDETGFEILRTGGGPNVTYTVGADTETYQDTAVAVGVNYTYQVRACNIGGCSAYSNSVSAVPVACVAIPAYTLIKDGDIFATIIGGTDTVSSKAIIKVVADPGFTDDVVLTMVSVTPFNPGFTPYFGNNPLSQAEYDNNIGSEFWVDVPGATPERIYTINIQGDANGLIRQIFPPLQLNVTSSRGTWWQW